MSHSPSLLSATAGKSLASINDIAEISGVSHATVRRAIARVMPHKLVNGVKTELNEAEATIIIDELKNNKTVTERIPLHSVSRLDSTETALTPQLKLKKAQMLMEEAYEALLAIETERADLAEQRLALQQPKVDFYDAVADSKDAIDMARVANVLNIKGYGRNKLFAFLRDHNILQSNNSPYQEYIDRGYFRVIETKWQRPDGEVCIYLKTIVQQKGVEFIRNKVLTSKEYIDAAIPDVADKLMDKGLLGD